MKKKIYYMFHKRNKFEGCTCDVDCMCEGHFNYKESEKIRKWNPFKINYKCSHFFYPTPPRG